PDLNDFRTCRHSAPAAVGAKRDAFRRGCPAGQRTAVEKFPGPKVPGHQCAVGTKSEKLPAVRTCDHLTHLSRIVLECRGSGVNRRVPDTDGVVLAGRCEALAVRRKRDGLDSLRMPAIDGQFVARSSVPKTNCLVVTRR